MPSGGIGGQGANHRKEPSDESEDYDDQYENTYSQGTPTVVASVEDDVPDTTMLDSVVLPAIATVSVV